MDLKQFQEASKRTMPFAGDPKNLIEFENMLGNYSMGLIGEATEAMAIINSVPLTDEDLANIKKELGDISHYAVGLAAISHIELPAHIELDYEIVDDIPVCETVDNLICEAGLIVEHAKKVIYHRHAFNAYEIDVVEILTLIKTLAKAHGFKYSDVLQTNIDKLKQRYPEKFSSADSIARKDEGAA